MFPSHKFVQSELGFYYCSIDILLVIIKQQNMSILEKGQRSIAFLLIVSESNFFVGVIDWIQIQNISFANTLHNLQSVRYKNGS